MLIHFTPTEIDKAFAVAAFSAADFSAAARACSAAATFAAWTRTWRLPIDSNAVNSAFELSGTVRETGYCGVKMYNPVGNPQFLIQGNVVNFRSRFPAAPSSITLAVRDASAGAPATEVQSVTRDGFAFTINGNVGSNSWSHWYGDYTAIA